MHVLLIAPEVAPLVVVTERADAIGGLVRALSAEGVELTIVAPALPNALHQRHALARRLDPLRFTLEGLELEVALLEGKLAGSGARVLLLEHPCFSTLSASADQNDATACATFARAALQAAVDLALGADLIHVHDWQTALVALLAHRLTTAAEIRDVPVVFSVHCLDLPGQFHPDAITQVSWFDEQQEGHWTMDGPSSLLYTGSLFADAVTTDSAAAARLLAEHLSHSGLPQWMANRLARQPPIAPIFPGLDYEHWSSATSRHITAQYSSANSSPKQTCKLALLERLGLAAKPNAPLVGLWYPNGGAAGLLDRSDDLAAAGVQLALIGPAGAGVVEKIERAARVHPGLLATLPGVPNEATVHHLLAGADALLVPPGEKHTALIVLKALAFGTIPLARASGDVSEIVVDYDPPSQTGTALLFADDSADAALTAIHRLCAVYQSELQWRALRQAAMRQRFSWHNAATQYLNIYRNLLAEAPSEIRAPA